MFFAYMTWLICDSVLLRTIQENNFNRFAFRCPIVVSTFKILYRQQPTAKIVILGLPGVHCEQRYLHTLTTFCNNATRYRIEVFPVKDAVND